MIHQTEVVPFNKYEFIVVSWKSYETLDEGMTVDEVYLDKWQGPPRKTRGRDGSEEIWMDSTENEMDKKLVAW